MRKATTNEIRRALILELSRVTDFDGIKTAFNAVLLKYPDAEEELQRIGAAIIRELKKQG